MTPVLGWWFARRDADGEVRLPHGDGRIVRVGETLTVPGPVVLCSHGLHASRYALDALQYAPGPILCRVRLSGEIREDDDKCAATERTTLAMMDATRTLRVFACCVARGALEVERSRGREPDARSWAAVEVAARHIDGDATDEELAAAWAAAWAAAGDAAWAAAGDAAWDAAADAAWAAARAAAWAAAADAAGAAARIVHRDVLERFALEAVGEVTGDGGKEVDRAP